MNCGNCKQSHATVQQVRDCYGNLPEVPAENFDHQWTKHVQQEAWGVRPVKPSEHKREASRAEQMAQINALGQRVPAGRYAIRNGAKAENDISFIHVQRPTEGRWAGKTFLKRQLSDTLERMPVPQQLDALLRIAQDVEGAMALYGHELGVCGNCGRTLTNEVSREYGIGPICRQALGFVA